MSSIYRKILQFPGYNWNDANLYWLWYFLTITIIRIFFKKHILLYLYCYTLIKLLITCCYLKHTCLQFNLYKNKLVFLACIFRSFNIFKVTLSVDMLGLFWQIHIYFYTLKNIWWEVFMQFIVVNKGNGLRYPMRQPSLKATGQCLHLSLIKKLNI